MTICRRCIAWVFSLLLLGVIVLPGCNTDVDFTPNIQPVSYQLPSTVVVTGIVDDVAEDFDVEVYTCNPSDLFLYRNADGAQILNADSSPVICDPKTFVRVTVSQTLRRLNTE